jgi:predicted metal-dependent phosphoesterase TrpH
LVKSVIHVHTNWSFDANASPEDVVATARRQGVGCVAITDHDQIGGALEAREIADRSGDVRIIVGEEVSSADGHIIGLFLHERIPEGMSAEDTARAIRAQGGVVLAAHPFASLCDNSLGREGLERLRPYLDAVEVWNAQNPLPWEDARAGRYARATGLTPYVGADSHVRGYLDACYQVLPAFRGAREFLAALRQAELHTGRFGPHYFTRMIVRHIWDKFARQRLPGFGVNVPADSREAQAAPVRQA